MTSPPRTPSPKGWSVVAPFLSAAASPGAAVGAGGRSRWSIDSSAALLVSPPRTPLPPYTPRPSHHRHSSSSLSSLSDAMGFVEKFAPAPPTRRSRSRYLLTTLVATILLIGFATIGHHSGVVDRVKETQMLRFGLLAFDDGKDALAVWREWAHLGAEDERAEKVVVQEQLEHQQQEQSSAPTEIVEIEFEAPVPAVPAEGPIRVSALPRPRMANPEDKETKYLSFLPHSGYHNQRIGLENALLLGYLLNRTVLIPPIWIGWPAMTRPYIDLQQEWTNAIALNPDSFQLEDASLESELSQPVSFASTEHDLSLASLIDHIKEDERRAAKAAALRAAEYKKQGWKVRPDGFPITNLTAADCKSYSVECRHTYKDTFLAWDFVANLDSAAELVPIVDRWDMRERALLPSLGLQEEDAFVLRDMTKYDFLISDVNELGEADSPLIVLNDDPLSKYARKVSIGALRQVPERLLLVGSLFGSGKIETMDPDRHVLREHFSQSLTFRNRWLTRPADEVSARLGHSYLGIHARLGDGVFRKEAEVNMEAIWMEMMDKLDVDDKLMRRLWNKVKPKKKGKKPKRHEVPLTPSDHPLEHDEVDDELGINAPPQANLRKRAPIDSSNKEWVMDGLTCRAPLHTQREMVRFNKPLYLATDSRDPTNDSALAIFFKTFPCTFILSDFDRPSDLNAGVVVESVAHMGRLENESDGLPLGRLFLPFLEAVIAAKADTIVGTHGSTFSGFAQGAMHRAYRAEREW